MGWVSAGCDAEEPARLLPVRDAELRAGTADFERWFDGPHVAIAVTVPRGRATERAHARRQVTGSTDFTVPSAPRTMSSPPPLAEVASTP